MRQAFQRLRPRHSCTELFKLFAVISDRQNAHLFSVAAAMKAFTRIKMPK